MIKINDPSINDSKSLEIDKLEIAVVLKSLEEAEACHVSQYTDYVFNVWEPLLQQLRSCGKIVHCKLFYRVLTCDS